MNDREIKFQYGFKCINGILKKVYHLSEIPNIAKKCDVWNVLPIVYVRQFTGLKDKNGVDIYEGDICLVDSFGSPKAEVKYVDKDGCYALYHDSFKRTVTEYKRLTRNTIKKDKIEVIGNIHTKE